MLKKFKVNGVNINAEMFESAAELVRVSATRTRTDERFHNMSNRSEVRAGFTSVNSLDEALELLRTGYQPSVEKLQSAVKVNGQRKRATFHNDVVGFAPVVPLAMMGVPQSMVNMTMTTIKAKVIDVYFDMTCSCSTRTETIIQNGQKLLSAILNLEMQGYRFNLYAIQSYYNRQQGADLLCVKVKNASAPLDIKRMSFPLTHPAFFRVIGFDWYSKVPGGTYRSGYGHALGYDFGKDKLNEMFRQMFGNKAAVVFSAAHMLTDIEGALKGESAA